MGLRINNLVNAPAYRVILDKPGQPAVIGVLSAPISFSTSANWQDTTSQLGGSEVQAVAQVFGRSTVIPFFTDQVWMGSNLVELSIRMTFLARSSAQSEVIDPMKVLLSWCLPPVRELATPPPVKKGEYITVAVGNWCTIPLLVPISVVGDPENVFSKQDGRPVKADVTVGLRTSSMVTAPDVQGWFS